MKIHNIITLERILALYGHTLYLVFTYKGMIFTESASRPIQSINHNVCVSIPSWKTPLSGGLETSGQRAYRYYWHTSTRIFCVLNIFKVFWSLQTSILCIVGELAGGGSVGVAVVILPRSDNSY